MTGWQFSLGALHAPGEGTRFRVWAPRAERVEVVLVEGGRVIEFYPGQRLGGLVAQPPTD